MIQEDSLVLKCKKVKWEGKMTKEKYKDKQKKISTVLNHEQLEIHTVDLDTISIIEIFLLISN